MSTQLEVCRSHADGRGVVVTQACHLSVIVAIHIGFALNTTKALDRATAPAEATSQSCPRTAPPSMPGRTLGVRLVILDALAIAVAWAVVLATVPSGQTRPSHSSMVVLAAVVVTVAAIAAHRLYPTVTGPPWSRVLRGTARSCTAGAVTVLMLVGVTKVAVPPLQVAAGAMAAFALLGVGRTAFNQWLRAQRSAGRFVHAVVLVGDDAEAVELLELVRDHTELGCEVRGYIGRPGAAGMTTLWLSDLTHPAAAIAASGATGALVSTSALDQATLDRVVRELLDHGVHVRLSCGLRGVTQQRLVAAPLAHHPLFYVAQRPTRAWHRPAKRALDLAVALLALVVLLPVLAVVALAIKLDSPGPVLFRQQRAGRGMAPFTIYKFRTMHADAEAAQALLRARNERDGPLFKLAGDPRVTRVGRLLRASSFDELPQLWNVIVGSMSLVGPRPLPVDEAAAVLEHVPARATVPPGLTGLWQVEARDNPSFGPLRRLDTYYVENLSISLDVRILASTVTHVSLRALRALRRQPTSAGSVIVLD